MLVPLAVSLDPGVRLSFTTASHRIKHLSAMLALSLHSRTKSTTASRVPWGTQPPVKAPQALYLTLRAPPSVRRAPHACAATCLKVAGFELLRYDSDSDRYGQMPLFHSGNTASTEATEGNRYFFRETKYVPFPI